MKTLKPGIILLTIFFISKGFCDETVSIDSIKPLQNENISPPAPPLVPEEVIPNVKVNQTPAGSKILEVSSPKPEEPKPPIISVASLPKLPKPDGLPSPASAAIMENPFHSREELSEQDDMLGSPRKETIPKISLTNSRLYDYTNYDSLKSRYGPIEPPSHSLENPYVIPEARLKELRNEFMYWYFDKGGPNDEGDWQRDIHWSTPQIHKNFNFQLPFFGFRFNYTRVSLNGYLEFSDPPEQYTYPLTFPNKDWPKKRDPAFIGIFFSKCRIGKLRPDDVDQREPGVYFRLERDLHTRTDVFGVEVRERLMWDIREGVIGSDSFIPKHAAFITWKNVSFAGGIDNTLYKTNTFQLVLATDEVYAYAMLNYKELQWTTHTEAGGDTTGGEGGTPAYIGFNAGNGTQSFEYKPYSQASVIRDLTGRGWANGFPGRHIFRIDEKIMLGTCNKDIAGANLPLVFAPESGNMLGGTVVNITGPCFEPNMRVKCRFDTEDVIGTIVDKNRAICIQPFLMAEGYVRFEVSVGDNAYNWKGKYFVETPATAAERIHFQTNDVHEKNPAEITITWDKYNLTTNFAASLTISIWGYKETTIRPQLMFIDVLETGVPNNGRYTIAPAAYRLRRNKPELLELQYGFIHINLTNPQTYSGSLISPVLWSRPIPLAWYFGPQWELKYGTKWPEALCDKWLMYDRYLKNFASEIPVCPCTLDHALLDKGRFLPDFSCDKDANPECYYHRGAVHCVKSGAPSLEGSEQQCCYDKNGYLMLSYDQQWGSRPRRSHNLGFIPWNEANKVPTLSQWFHDMIPFYTCCLWQEEQAVGCETLRFERRPSQDCVAYQSPYVATVFGDPHIITFDGVEYTFNGKGEFVLVQANQGKNKLNIQGRFEQVSDNLYGEVRATMLTAIAAQDNSSAIIEVRMRPKEAQWRYRLDVLADGRRVYFDRPSLKVQHFAGVTVYTPTYILNQSEVIIMFPSGAGIEVIENKGFMAARVYLPWNFLNKTKGLLGNWSFDVNDEFILPDGTLAGVSTSANANNFQSLHKNFGLAWMLQEREENEKGGALFTRENGRLGSFYSNYTFEPEYRISPADIIPSNRSYDLKRTDELCGGSYQCKYDYAMTLNRDMAHFTLNYHDSYINIQKMNERKIISCGVLETPRFGRKSNFLFIPGTKVTFECNQDFTLVGDQRRTCMANGHWDVPQYGYTECLRRTEYEQRQGWVTTAIIGGTLLPLIIALLLIYMCYVRDKPEARSISSWKYFQNRLTTTKSPESSILSSQPKDENDSSPPHTFRREYDKSYRTGEPIPGKPLIDFSEREPSLEHVTDDDVQKFENRHTFRSESAGSKSGSFVSGTHENGADLRSILESSSESSKIEEKNEIESSTESSSSDEELVKNKNIETNVYSSESHEGSESDGPKYERLHSKPSSDGSASGKEKLSKSSSDHSRSSGSSKASSRKSKNQPDRLRYSKASTSRLRSSSGSDHPKISVSSTGSSSKGSAIQTAI